LVSTEFSEGTDVDVEQNFVEMGDIELPDDDPVQCRSEFCVICNELATEQRYDERVSVRYLDSQNLALIGKDANTGVCCYVKVIRRAFSHAVREVLYRALTSETKSSDTRATRRSTAVWPVKPRQRRYCRCFTAIMTAAAAALLVAVNKARKPFRVSAEHSVMTVAAIIVVSSK